MLRPCKFALLLTAITALNAFALPTNVYSTSRLVRRQAFTGPRTVNTVDTFQTPVGLVTENCQVTLTPVKGDIVGQDLVREERNCTVTVAGVRNAAPPLSAAPPPPPPVVAPPTVASPPPARTTLSAPAVISSVASRPPPPPATVAPPPSAGLTTTGSVIGTTSAQVAPPVSAPVPVTPVTSTSVAPPVSVPPASVPPASVPPASIPASVPASPVSIPASPLTSTVASAAEQASSAAPFQIPGKKLEVLPIGLGVFAGISVIALIVVGLVTYERTKYRRTYRQRKLAETAQPMGYGGMAERA